MSKQKRWKDFEVELIFDRYCEIFPVKGVGEKRGFFPESDICRFSKMFNVERKTFTNFLSRVIYRKWSPREDEHLLNCIDGSGNVDYERVFPFVPRIKRSKEVIDERLKELRKRSVSGSVKSGPTFGTVSSLSGSRTGRDVFIITPKLERSANNFTSSYDVYLGERESSGEELEKRFDGIFKEFNDGLSELISSLNSNVIEALESYKRNMSDLRDLVNGDMVKAIGDMKGVISECKKMEDHISSQKKFAESYILPNVCNSCGKDIECSCNNSRVVYCVDNNGLVHVGK